MSAMEQPRHSPGRNAWIGLACVLGGVAWAEGPAADPTLAALEAEALAAVPELAQARAEVSAAAERVPQVQAWPEPRLQVGLQHDGFSRWQVGRSEMSWILFMAEQTFPFPGKLALAGEVASAEVTARRLSLERARLSTLAELRRSYLALQLARARLGLTAQLVGLVDQAREVAQRRYEAGDGPQVDVLRAQLELGTLAQRRTALAADERQRLQALNRLRGHALDDALATPSLDGLSFPTPPDEAAALTRALAASPEHLAAQAGVLGAERARALAERGAWPDLTLGLGVMVRGSLEPMWTVSLAAPLPVFAAARQGPAAAEAAARLEGQRRAVDVVAQALRLRTAQRLVAWRALAELWQTYRGRLLTDAAATQDATLTQLRVGKVPFAAALEAARATVGLQDASAAVLADAWRLAIADDELSLGEVPASAAALPLPGGAPTSGM